MSENSEGPSTATKLVAEALGTFLLVFGSIGTALFASCLLYTSDAADE